MTKSWLKQKSNTFLVQNYSYYSIIIIAINNIFHMKHNCKTEQVFKYAIVIQSLRILTFKITFSADKPKIDTSPSIAKSASDKGKTGVLTCKAKGAPDVSFNWSRKGAVINVEKSDGKYEVFSKMVDRSVFCSTNSTLLFDKC